jgi:hypothetical protein
VYNILLHILDSWLVNAYLVDRTDNVVLIIFMGQGKIMCTVDRTDDVYLIIFMWQCPWYYLL